MTYSSDSRRPGFQGMGAATAQAPTPAQAVPVYNNKVINRINQANRDLASLLRPLGPAIDQLPISAQHRQVLKDTPIDGLMLMFAPIEDRIIKVVDKVNAKTGSRVVMGLPPKPRKSIDTSIRVPGDENMPRSTREWVRRMRMINAFLMQTVGHPALTAQAVLEVFGSDVSYVFKKMADEAAALKRRADMLAQDALRKSQAAIASGQQAAQRVAEEAKRAADKAIEDAKRAGQNVINVVTSNLPKPPGFRGLGIGPAAAAPAAAAGAPVGATAGATAATTTGVVVAEEASPSIAEMLLDIFQTAQKDGTLKEVVKSGGDLSKDALDAKNSMAREVQAASGAAPAAEVASQPPAGGYGNPALDRSKAGQQGAGMSDQARMALTAGAALAAVGAVIYLVQK